MIKKSQLELIYNVLSETDLGLPDARVRDAFLRTLKPEIKAFYEDKDKVIDKFCLKDSEGKAILSEGNYQFIDENIEGVKTEMTILMDEVTNITLDDTIKSFIAKTNYKPKVGQAEVIDELLK